MRMRWIAALPLLALVWSAFSAQETAKAPPFRQLDLASMRLSFEYPADWKLDDSDAQDLHLVMLYGPWKRRLEHPKITVFHYPPDAPGYRTKDDYLNKRLLARKGRDKGGDVVRQEARVDGVPAVLLTFSFVDTLGTYSMDLHREPVRETCALFDAPQGGFYVIYYRAAQAIYPDYYPVFDRVLRTTRLSRSAASPI